jgi:hypothetical protein
VNRYSCAQGDIQEFADIGFVVNDECQRIVHYFQLPDRIIAPAGEGDAKAAAAAWRGDVVQAQAVRLAELFGNVEAEAGPRIAGGEEGFEHLLNVLGGDALPIIDDIDKRSTGLAGNATVDLNAQGFGFSVEVFQRMRVSRECGSENNIL